MSKSVSALCITNGYYLTRVTQLLMEQFQEWNPVSWLPANVPPLFYLLIGPEPNVTQPLLICSYSQIWVIECKAKWLASFVSILGMDFLKWVFVIYYGLVRKWERWKLRKWCEMWELNHKEGWAPKNWCFWIVVLEKTWESLVQQGDQTNQSWQKLILNIQWKDWCWSSNNLATWCKQPTHWKRPWC